MSMSIGGASVVIVEHKYGAMRCDAFKGKLEAVLQMIDRGDLGGGWGYGCDEHKAALHIVERQLAETRRCIAEQEANDAASGVTVGAAVSTPYQFWLIERGPNEGVSQHQWWNEGPDGRVMGWKSSVHEATRYPSKEAAERVVSANRGLRDLPTSVTSHSFVDAADGVAPTDAMPEKLETPSTDASETVSAIYRALSRGNNRDAQALAQHFLDAKHAAARNAGVSVVDHQTLSHQTPAQGDPAS